MVDVMRAMVINRIVSLDDDQTPLALVDIPMPEPNAGEIRLKVSACGVCHTELDEIEGRTAPPVLPIVPGHEVIGRVTSSAGAPTGSTRAIGSVSVGSIHQREELMKISAQNSKPPAVTLMAVMPST